MSQTPSVTARMAASSDPAAGVPRELVFDFLMQAPRLRDTQPVHWKYLNAPQIGTVMLVWQSHAEFGTDGYVWGAPEQSFSMDHKGYTIEIRVQKCGYASPNENVTQYTRYRYRLVNAPPNSQPIDPLLWIVHYSRAESDDQIPINRIQIPPQMQQTLAMRRALQSHGTQLARRDFWLHDRNTWSTLILPPQMARGGYPPPHAMAGRPSPAGYYPGQPGVAQQVRPMKTRGSLPGTFEFSLDDEETATGDFLDIMSPRDISRMRYKCNHEWMEEIFASPFRNSQITPVDLGLGRKGELAALTMPFFDAPMGPGRSAASAANEQVEKHYFGKLPPGKSEEFANAATKKIAALEAEMDTLKRKHLRRLEKMARLKRLSEAEIALRDAYINPSDTGTEPWRVECCYHDTSGDVTSRNEVDGSLPKPKVADIVNCIETALNKSVIPTSDVVCVQKGDLLDKPGPIPSAGEASGEPDTQMNDFTDASQNQSATTIQEGGLQSITKPEIAKQTNEGATQDVAMGGMITDTSATGLAPPGPAAPTSDQQGWAGASKDETNAPAQVTANETRPPAGDTTKPATTIAESQASTQPAAAVLTAAAGTSTAQSNEQPSPNYTAAENELGSSNFDDVSGFNNEDSAGDALAAFTEEQQSGLDLEGFQESEFGDAFGASERRNDDDVDDDGDDANIL
ncbi:hypothetical protein KEM54_000310 [Ascosphaera aggregata]|nr:hypothetical protein KEM54_000310 [Ascosphaera aggregata]